MNKKILILALVVVFALSGCTNASGSASEEFEIKTLNEDNNIAEDGEVVEEGSRENFDRVKISGEITKIVGNVVTLALFEVPERSGDGTGTGSGEESESRTSPLAGTTAPPTQGGKSGGNGAGNRMASFEKTGETLELIIPVGTEIKSTSNPDMSFDIESLSKGMNILVFVDGELTDKEKESNPDSNIIYASSINIIQTD